MGDLLFGLLTMAFIGFVYCLFVVALADSHDVEAAQRWVCVFDERPYCEVLRYDAGSDSHTSVEGE